MCREGWRLWCQTAGVQNPVLLLAGAVTLSKTQFMYASVSSAAEWLKNSAYGGREMARDSITTLTDSPLFLGSCPSVVFLRMSKECRCCELVKQPWLLTL